MHLYKHFWKMLGNNKKGIIIYLLIAAIMMLVVAVISSSIVNDKTDSSISINAIDISYIDNDNSVVSNGIREYLSKNNNLVDYSDKSENEINTLIYFSITDFHIDIPADFQMTVNAGEKDGEFIHYRSNATGSAEVYTLESMINSYINTYKHYVDEGCSPEEAVDKTYKLLTKEVDISIRRNQNSLGGTAKEWSIYEMSVYFIYISLGMILLSAGTVIVKSNDEVICKRIDTSPSTPFARTIADTVGLYTYGIIIWVILAFAEYIYGFDTELIKNRGYLMLIGQLLIIICNCSLTAFISSFRLGQDALSKIANVVGLSMSFLSGVFVPQWLLGEGVLQVAKFVPFYWSVRSFNMIYSESGAGLSFDLGEVYKCFGMLCVFILVFVICSIFVRKGRLNAIQK